VRLNARLQRLERRVVDPGCPGCRERRGFNVLVNAHRLPDGTLAYPNDDEPKPLSITKMSLWQACSYS
jgi:hypothetical protein